jgi:hypothetical protein
MFLRVIHSANEPRSTTPKIEQMLCFDKANPENRPSPAQPSPAQPSAAQPHPNPPPMRLCAPRPSGGLGAKAVALSCVSAPGSRLSRSVGAAVRAAVHCVPAHFCATVSGALGCVCASPRVRGGGVHLHRHSSHCRVPSTGRARPPSAHRSEAHLQSYSCIHRARHAVGRLHAACFLCACWNRRVLNRSNLFSVLRCRREMPHEKVAAHRDQ